ncbi:LuxR family transcriptional regulator [Leifsonia aquatica]|uniref:LuxR family transcriptional regulator n=1 Tax=Leifsonia aquatica TaxID=144185 RepID=UPI00046A3719|nr:LuxR family transcriptional regulator [Leifsonia aquatica]
MVLTALGRFSDARDVLARLEELPRSEATVMPRALGALALVGLGELDRAVAELNRGLDEARNTLDIEAAFTYGTGAILCHLFAGDHLAVDRILDTLMATGNPLPFLPTVRLTMLSVAAVVSLRRGSVDLGERYIQELEAQGLPDGAFPAQSLSWARAQLLSFNGDIDGAAAVLREASARLWERGARFAAVLGLLGAAELTPTAQRLAELTPLAERIEGPFVPAYLAYVRALVSHSAGEMLEPFQLTSRVGLNGVAISALRNAAGWFAEADDSEGAAQAQRLEEEFRERRRLRSVDTARFTTGSAVLTDRKHEVAELAAAGLSNQEIASRLVLSVRTVETHMHRIMRKLDIGSRQELKHYLG